MTKDGMQPLSAIQIKQKMLVIYKSRVFPEEVFTKDI